MDDARAPEGVRMIINGREIPCTMQRMPSEDHECDGGEHVRAWLAIPDVPVVVAPGFCLEWKATVLPARTSLLFEISAGVPVAELN